MPIFQEAMRKGELQVGGLDVRAARTEDKMHSYESVTKKMQEKA